MNFFIFILLQSPQLFAQNSESQNILLIVAQPNLNNFNHPVFGVLANQIAGKGHHVAIHNLYQTRTHGGLQLVNSNYSPDFRINTLPNFSKEQSEILWANHLIFIYPSGNISAPSIMKDYFDRTIVPLVHKTHSKENGLNPDKKVTLFQIGSPNDHFFTVNELDDSASALINITNFKLSLIQGMESEIPAEIYWKSYTDLKGALEELDALIGEFF